MRRRRTLMAAFSLGLLFVSPLAWGCEGTGMQNCSMSDCPMMAPQEAEGCHESEDSSDQGSSECDGGPGLEIACCDSPLDPEPAKVDSQVSSAQTEAPLVVLAERVEPRSPSRPPDLISEAISSRQHELGRFTLLSSYLL